MTTSEIAEKLISYYREGKWEEAQKELYAEDVVSIEAEASPVFDKITKGLPAIIEKGIRLTASPKSFTHWSYPNHSSQELSFP
jgi:hypothetical protein